MEAFEIRKKIEDFVENFVENSGSSKTPYQVMLAKFVELFNLDMWLNELEEKGVPDSDSEREQYYEELDSIRKEVEEICES